MVRRGKETRASAPCGDRRVRASCGEAGIDVPNLGRSASGFRFDPIPQRRLCDGNRPQPANNLRILSASRGPIASNECFRGSLPEDPRKAGEIAQPAWRNSFFIERSGSHSRNVQSISIRFHCVSVIRNGAGSGLARSNCDVCIVGAGLAGLYLAQLLRRLGMSVSILERGSRTAAPPASDSVIFPEDTYLGALEGRAFGLGGTSTLWGGQLTPMALHEMSNQIAWESHPWPFSIHELGPHYRAVCENLGLSAGAYESIHRADQNDGAGFSESCAISLPARSRNLFARWRASIESDKHLEIHLESRITRIQTQTTAGGRGASSISFEGPSGQMEVCYRSLVIAAGALESTRIVLDLLQESPFMNREFQVGSNLQDHLSIPICALRIRDLALFHEYFSLRLKHSGILFKRLFTTSELERELGIPAGFLHIVYSSQRGFPRWLHDAQSYAQRSDWLALARTLTTGVKYIPTAIGLTKGVIMRRRIEWPPETTIALHLDMEQFPDTRNRVNLDHHSTTAETRNLSVTWAVRERDRIAHQTARKYLADTWSSTKWGAAVEMVPLGDHPPRPREVFHPTGTLRMHDSSKYGAVDRDCRVHDFSNVFVLSTATFPRCGAGNPSFTLLALAERLGAHLREE